MTFFLNKNIFLDFLPFCGGEKPGSGAGNPSVGRKSLGWGGESRMGDRKLDNLGGGGLGLPTKFSLNEIREN